MELSRPHRSSLILTLVLSFALCASLILSFAFFEVREAEAATLHRGDVSQARSGGIVLDADLYTRQPLFDVAVNTTTEASNVTPDTVHTYSYALGVPANGYRSLGRAITARWDDVGFDGDDERIDLIITWHPDSQWYSSKYRAEIPLLQRYDQNGYHTAGISIGIDSKTTGGKICCEQHLTFSFLKHGTSTPATGSFLMKIADLDQTGWDGAFNDRWCESIEFISGHDPDIYAPQGNVLNIGKNRNGEEATDYRATQKMDGSSLDSGLVVRLTHGAEFWYYSTRGWTDILDQFAPMNIALTSQGSGSVHCNGKRDQVAVGWRGSRTISIEPEPGHKIAAVHIDGAPVEARSSYNFDDVTTNHAIDAAFAPIEYRVHFSPQGGTGSMDDLHLSYGSSAQLPTHAYTRIGHTFTGWNTHADGSGVVYHDGQEVRDLTNKDGAVIDLYAQWEPLSYHVTFDANEGSGAMEDQSFTYDHTDKLAVNQFSRRGYLFTGWNTHADGSGASFENMQEVKNLTAEPDGALTLYAQWQPIAYFIAFDGQGGLGRMDEQRLTFDRVEELLPNSFVRTGYRWVGWNTDPSVPETWYEDRALVENLAHRANEIVSLYAIWSANRCLIIYDSNGGSGSMRAQSLAYGTAEQLRASTFEREGYHWVSWNTAPDGSGETFTSEQTVQDLSTIDNSTITLYAIWERDEPTDPAPPSPDVTPPDEEDFTPPDIGQDSGPAEQDPSEGNDSGSTSPDQGSADQTGSSVDQSNADPSQREDGSQNEDQLTPENELTDVGTTEQALADNADSLAKDQSDDHLAKDAYDKTGGSIVAIACIAIITLASGVAVLILGARRRRRERETKRRIYRTWLEP